MTAAGSPEGAVERRTRVLYVTAGFPFPLHSGYLRHHHLLRHLAAGHHLHLVSLAGPQFDDDDVDGVAPFVDRVDTFRRPATGRTARRVDLLRPARPDPAARDLAALVEREVGAGAVDVVVLTGKETASVLDAVGGRVPVVVDLCDATSVRLGQEMSVSSGARRAALRVRRHRMRAVEAALVERADALLVASARDRTGLADEGAPGRVASARVVPNGIDVDRWRRRSERLGRAVTFCGNLAYGPNADAARHLVEDVMPLVWSERPDVEVLIVGRGAPDALVAALDRPGVELTGAVDDVRPHLERGAVFAAPMRIATGIQNKLLEAMAMEMPVVTTPVGAAGLVVDGPPPMAVADDPAALAAQVRAALDRDGEPDRDARRWVAERFDWAASGRALADTIAECLTRFREKELTSC